MAKNQLLKPRTIQDIDKRVDRILRGLGNPEPPFRLEEARELLELDLEFYTADDPDCGGGAKMVSPIPLCSGSKKNSSR